MDVSAWLTFAAVLVGLCGVSPLSFGVPFCPLRTDVFAFCVC